jgi:hypothetical protein
LKFPRIISISTSLGSIATTRLANIQIASAADHATENMRATILAILLGAGALILDVAVIISGIVSGDISQAFDIWPN